MSNKPLNAKIVSVATASYEGLNADSIMVNFRWECRSYTRDFGSPFLIDESMQMWRRVCLYVVLGRKIAKDDPAIFDFPTYEKALVGRDVLVAFDEKEVYALGTDPKNLFFPDMYALWLEPEDVGGDDFEEFGDLGNNAGV